MKTINLYRAYIWLSVKSLWVYRTDFIVGSVGFLLSNSALFFSILIMFTFIEELGGWNLNEVILLYSFVTLSRALWNTFMFNIMSLGEKIKTGKLDILLLRPVNPLLQLLTEKFDPDTIGEVFFSLVIFIYSLIVLDLVHFYNILLILLLLISSILTFAAIHLIVHSLCFWLINNDGLSTIIWQLDDLTTYPMSVFPRWLKAIVIIVPFAFVGYYPMAFLLDKSSNNFILNLLSIIGGPIFFFLSYRFWLLGLTKYQSTGS
ncbi:ABC transporter permease [Lysinibacillus xylanilyticus]|uniref:ABC transporter permease n=1 Tax=Lysinibacillus xylanilyticus TaxID=582475 RepID=UPI0037F7C3B5